MRATGHHPSSRKLISGRGKCVSFLLLLKEILLTTFTDYASNQRPIILKTPCPQGTRLGIYLNGEKKPINSKKPGPSTSNVAALDSGSQLSERPSSPLSSPPPQRSSATRPKAVEQTERGKAKQKEKGKETQSKGKKKQVVEDDVVEVSSDEPVPKKKKKVLRSTQTPTYIHSVRIRGRVRGPPCRR